MRASDIITPEFSKWFQKRAAGLAARRNWFIEVEDVAQDSLIRIYRAIESGGYVHESTPKLKAFAVTVLTRLAINAMKKAKREETVSINAISGEDDRQFDVPAPNEDMIKDEQHDDVKRALYKLNPRRRKVATLCLQNHRTRDIVTIMRQEGEPNITPQAVSRLRGEAIKELRSFLNDQRPE